jgi:hypothetical protein
VLDVAVPVAALPVKAAVVMSSVLVSSMSMPVTTRGRGCVRGDGRLLPRETCRFFAWLLSGATTSAIRVIFVPPG